MDKKLITVTSPLLPNLDDFHAELQKIWDSKWITNNGDYHKKLENAQPMLKNDYGKYLLSILDEKDQTLKKNLEY